MARQYARFESAVIGPGLATSDSGLVLTTTTDSTSRERMARSTFSRTGDTYGAEFVFWGDADLYANIGLVDASESLAAEVGIAPLSIGWRLDTGEVFSGGDLVAYHLPGVQKGQIVGVTFYAAPGSLNLVRFELDGTTVAEIDVGDGDTWHYAVSMASDPAGELSCAVNAGQWSGRGESGTTGWPAPTVLVETIYLANRHWLSASSDEPANQRYEGRIIDDGVEETQRVGFWPWADAVAQRPTGAQVLVSDPDGALAGLTSDVAAAMLQVDLAGTRASAAAIGRYALDSVEVVGDQGVRLRLRDGHDALDEPINPSVFLPYVPALAWKAQPVVIGACASVPLLSANNDGTVGFLADSPIGHVDVVLDRGDALEPGMWTLTADGQQLFLDSPPLGPVLADVSTADGTMTPATLAQALHDVFSRVRFGAWLKTEAEAIDTATGYAGIGYYVGSEVRSARQARDMLLANYCASAWQDADGVLRLVRLTAPEDAVASMELQTALQEGDLLWAYDQAPNLTRRMSYRPNGAVMGAGDFVTDLVDVPMSRRMELMQPARGIVYSGITLHPRYDAASRREPMPSGFWERADAQAEIDRVCGLYAVERRFYTWTGTVTGSLPAIGEVVSVIYPAYGLDAGRNLLVVSLQHNRATGRVTIRFWGA